MTVARAVASFPPDDDVKEFSLVPPARPSEGALASSPQSGERALVEAEDEPLVIRARTGDSAAFHSLFQRYAPGVRRYLGDLLRDDAAADDATQETFVRAYDRLLSLREVARVRMWLFGIARNVFLEQYRARRQERRALPENSEEPAALELVDTAPTPDAILLGREAARVLADALSYVGEPRKSALLLRLDHGLPYEDIAEVMGWSVAKVKNEIHRARLQLRTQLVRYLGGAS